MFFKGSKIPQHILINRTDAMGDVVLALPVCGLIKKYYPQCKISFLGRSYTEAIAMTSVHVDAFINRDDWNNMNDTQISTSLIDQQIDTVIHLLPAKEVIKACFDAKINTRIGGMNKVYYWLYCNRIVPFSRKKSRLSEAQLNIKLLSALDIKELPARNEVYKYYGFTKIAVLNEEFRRLLNPEKFNLVIHPLSNKNAKEWGLHNFASLIKLIDPKKVQVFITGSVKEKEILSGWIAAQGSLVTDMTAAFNTAQLVAFIAAADGLIASSTGPVHIAAAAGIYSLGLYENRWTKRGERWGPIGINAEYLQCINEDMDTITAEMVIEKLQYAISKANKPFRSI